MSGQIDNFAPSFAPFFGMSGIFFAMAFGCMGAAYGTAKAGVGIAGIGTYRPDLIMKLTRDQSLIPIVMSGILAVYALVISVLIASDIKPPPEKEYSLFAGFMHMGAGLSVGLSGLAAGYAIGIVGDAVRASCVVLQSL
ncbi:v-type proton ATPase 16 kDa proteolipid subunit 2 [Epicoccum nigrum]|nr:v-type proton ATPase 16 kDa proteolipid subunit 2 [Epicoccum nigrum]